jgi:hypothetical protein
MRRKALAQAKQQREVALQATADRQREQQQFEEAAGRGEHRSTLRRTLISYEEGLTAVGEAEAALVNAKADLNRLKNENGGIDTVKLGKSLGAGRDLVDATELKLTRVRQTLAQAQTKLREALEHAR